MKLHRQEVGSGFPLIILHGLFGAHGNWRTLSRNVFGAAFRTIAVDLRNHGRSPHSEVFDYPSTAGDIVELMDDEGLDRAHILGHSLGGKVAMQMALDHPDRVDRLIVADVAPRAYEPRHDYIFEALLSVDFSDCESREDVDAALATHISSSPVRQFLMKNLDRTDEGYRWKMNLPVIHRAYQEINAAIESETPFEGDTLFVGGGASNYVSEADLPEIRSLFPKARLEMMPGVGHWLHAEDPDGFSRIVMEFLGA